jgi:hypothetical protein
VLVGANISVRPKIRYNQHFFMNIYKYKLNIVGASPIGCPEFLETQFLEKTWFIRTTK